MSVELSEKGLAFLEAWKIHDRAALRLSTKADVERRNGRPFYPSAMTLRDETDLMVSTKKEYCEELNTQPVYFMTTLQSLRRSGVDHEKAVKEVVAYLQMNHDAA